MSNKWEKCIICFDFRNKDGVWASEHIVPEFLGGALQEKFICKICNSDMGNTFESGVEKTPHIQEIRKLFNIKGKKRSTLKSSIEGVFNDDKGSKYYIEESGSGLVSKKLNSKFDVTAKEREDGSINIQVECDFDPKAYGNFDQVKQKIKKAISREVKSKGFPMPADDELQNLFDNLRNNRFEEKINAKKSMGKIYQRDIDLLAIKIAYEIFIYHYGPESINTPGLEILRALLIKAMDKEVISVSSDLIVNTPPCPEKHLNIFDETSHWVILYGRTCFVKIQPFDWLWVNLHKSEDNMYNERHCYRFSMKEKNWSIEPLPYIQ